MTEGTVHTIVVRLKGACGDFVERTFEGGRALTAALAAVQQEPERLLTFVAHDVTAATRIFPHLPAAYKYADPAIFLLQAANTTARHKQYVSGQGAQRSALTAELVGTGLLLTALSRAAKERAEVSSGGLGRPNVVGVASVIGAQAAFSAVALRAGGRPQPVGVALRAGAWALAVAGAGWAAHQGKVARAMIPAVALGGAAALTTSALTGDEGVFRAGTTAARGTSHGANLMVAAEAVTFLRALTARRLGDRYLPNAEQSNVWRLLAAFETTTLVIATHLLADGLFQY